MRAAGLRSLAKGVGTSRSYTLKRRLVVLALPVMASSSAWAQTVSSPRSDAESILLDELTVQGDARDAPAGVSTVTKQDIEKIPTRDLSDALRLEPGLALTGASAGGRTGNKRQIDIRGMGPEYTVILVDGVRVSSRDSARFTVGGSRNTLGDTGFVPPGAVERIEVIRGPAAAIYGSGAIGGVINIITKKAGSKPSTSVNSTIEVPQNPKEGWTRQIDFLTSGPVSEVMSYRIYGGFSKRSPDAADINGPVNPGTGGTEDIYGTAGRDGIVNGNINGLVSTSVAPGHTFDLQGGYTRQDGLFAGEIYNYCGRGCRAYFPPTLLFPNGSTWNRLERTTASVTHRGDWEFGKSRITAAFEGTNNQRREETLFAGDGTLASLAWQRPSQLRNYLLDGEMLTPFQTGPLSHVVTLGFDLRRETLFDQSSTSLALPDNRPKDPFMSANYAGLFVKDDIRFGNWVLSPGVRVDDTTYGSHVGPSMYLAWNATDWLTFKGGVADAFKAPNVYQTNPSYAYNSYGNGCFGRGPCYILGSPDLKPETSINKEIGFAVNYAPILFSLTYFDNEFENKITTSRIAFGQIGGCSSFDGGLANCNLLRWENAQNAIINGLEGRARWDMTDTLALDVNFTKFFKSEDTKTGETISFTPDYIVNTTLTWKATGALTLNLIVQSFGEQTSRSVDPSIGGNVLRNDSTINPYTLVGTSAIYDLNENTRLRAGISNLLDTKVLRQQTTAAGNNTTFNESGRTFWGGVNLTF